MILLCMICWGLAELLEAGLNYIQHYINCKLSYTGKFERSRT